MLKKIGTNGFWLMWCMVLLSAFGIFSNRSVFAQSGIDSYTKLMLHIENNVTDSAAGKTVTNNNVTFSNSVYKMGGYSGVFNGSNAYLFLADICGFAT